MLVKRDTDTGTLTKGSCDRNIENIKEGQIVKEILSLVPFSPQSVGKFTISLSIVTSLVAVRLVDVWNEFVVSGTQRIVRPCASSHWYR